MRRKADCWDNTVAENFFKTLKAECVYQQKHNTIKEAEISVFEYIEIWHIERGCTLC
jgi:transposase InsO family protein